MKSIIRGSTLSQLLKSFKIVHNTYVKDDAVYNPSASSKSLNILFLTNTHNSMSQRAMLEMQKLNHRVTVQLATSAKSMIEAKHRVKPDIILCPFLTSKVPEEVWKDETVPTLIVHPGVQGDRGRSSLDWAIKQRREEWGVTILQAIEELDAGNIWSTRNFLINRKDQSTLTKSSLYKNEVSDCEMGAIIEAVNKFQKGESPFPLKYTKEGCIGLQRQTMKQIDRTFSWNDSSEDIVHRIRFSTGQPGVKISILGKEYFVYDAVAEPDHSQSIEKPVGSILYKRCGAIAFKAKDGIVWIRSLKKAAGGIKLPAELALPEDINNNIFEFQIGELKGINSVNSLWEKPTHFQDVWTYKKDEICYVHFDFPNGACSTEQCQRLKMVLANIKVDPTIKTVVLLGGYDQFSNGIHLNVIENADDPYTESVKNINAINDVIKKLNQMSNKLTISVLQGNAGAGGVMQAIAADLVLAHEGVILNPHYRTMGLYGSEYWTYFLKDRVGKEMALQLTEGMMPILADKAVSINLINNIIGKNVEELRENLEQVIEKILKEGIDDYIKAKIGQRDHSWEEIVEKHRAEELSIMNENFKTSGYNNARRNFVRKIKTENVESLISSPTLMKGKPIQAKIVSEIKFKVQELASQGFSRPNLHVLMVPENPASMQYVSNKQKLSEEAHINTVVTLLDAKSNNLEEDILKLVGKLNADDNCDGIIVQLPLPDRVNVASVFKAINSEKDVDGLSSDHLGKLVRNEDGIYPCTAQACLRILQEYGVQVLGKSVVVIGKSPVVGMSVAIMLMHEGATVSVFTLQSRNLKEYVSKADVVISSAGVPNLLDQSWLKKGAHVINVGMTLTKGNFLGDIEIDPKTAECGLYTKPVGGVGPITVAKLLENTLFAKIRRLNKQFLSHGVKSNQCI